LEPCCQWRLRGEKIAEGLVIFLGGSFDGSKELHHPGGKKKNKQMLGEGFLLQ